MAGGLKAFETYGEIGLKGLETVKRGLSEASADAKKSGVGIGQAFAVAGSIIASIGIAAWLEQGAEKAMAAEVATGRLKTVVENTGVAYASVEASINSLLSAQSRQSAFSRGELRGALTELTLMTHDVGKAQGLLGLTADLARAKEIDLSTAAMLIGKVYAGNVSMLKRYGIVVKEGATAAEALAEIQKVVAGAAEEYASTTEGRMKRAENAISSFQTRIGSYFLPVIGAAADGVSALMDEIDKLPPGTRNAVTGIIGIGSAAAAAAPTLLSMADSIKNVGGVMAVLRFTGIAGLVALGAAFQTLVASGVTRLADAIRNMIPDWGGWKSSVDGVAASLLTAVPPLQQLWDLMHGAGASAKLLGKDVGGVGSAATGAKPKIEGVSGALDDEGSAADDAAGATKALARALDGTKQPADSLAAAMRGATDAEISSKRASLDLAEAHRNVKKALDEHGRKSPEYQRAVLDEREAQLRAKDASADYKEALQKQKDAAAKAAQDKTLNKHLHTTLGDLGTTGGAALDLGGRYRDMASKAASAGGSMATATANASSRSKSSLSSIRGTTSSVGGWFASMKSSVSSHLSSMVSSIASYVSQAVAQMAKLNPFLRRSPSLVDNVQAGVAAIKKAYESLNHISILAPDVSRVQSTLSTTADVIAELKKKAADLAGTWGLGDTPRADEEMTSGSVLSAMQSQVATMASFSGNLATLVRRGLSKELIDELVKSGPNAFSEAAALAAMSDTDLGQMNALVQARGKLAEQLSQWSGPNMPTATRGNGTTVYIIADPRYTDESKLKREWTTINQAAVTTGTLLGRLGMVGG